MPAYIYSASSSSSSSKSTIFKFQNHVNVKMKYFHQSLQQSAVSSTPSPFLKLFSASSSSKTPTNPHLKPHRNHPHSPLTTNQTTPNNNAHFPIPLNSSTATLPTNHPRLARQLFVKIPQPNFNFHHNQSPQFRDPLRSFKDMLSRALDPSQYDYGNALSACADSQNLECGKQIFSLVMKNGCFSNGFVITGLINLFSKGGLFGDALRMFEENCGGNVVCWNAIIAGGVRNGENAVALDLFRRMVSEFCMPNEFTFSIVLRACAVAGEWEVGRAIHGWVLKCDIKDDIVVGTSIVDLYAKCGDMDDAIKEFSRMPSRNVVSWTAMLSGFVQKENADNAVKFFREMIRSDVEVNKYTLTSILMVCSNSLMVKETLQIHCWTFKNGLFSVDPVVKESFITTYAKNGNLMMSDKIFEEMGLAKSMGSWSAMMSGLVQNHSLKQSAELFKRMFYEGFKPDKKCTSGVLSIVDSTYFGRQIHAYALKVGLVLDVHVGSALLTMYSKCGNIEDSYELFTQMNERDSVSWTSMVSGFAVHGHTIKSLKLFREMVLEGIHVDQTTYFAVLMACNDPQFLMNGKEIHGHALRSGIGSESPLGSALVSMYSRCKDVVSARRVFDVISCKDQTLWSSLVSCYSTNGLNEAAFSEFHRMILSGFGLDHIICSSVLGICADLSKPILGEQLHAHGIKAGIKFYLSVSSALVTMYSKCGSIDNSWKVFKEIAHPDLVTWTAIIDGYAQHGRGLEALGIFEQMKRDGVRPDLVTFLSVLSACNHSGLVEEGFTHFDSMRGDYGIQPGLHHYACMVDLLGRSGRLKEAANFINEMPINPDWTVWSTLLGACKVHGHVELGKLAAKKVLELEPRDSGAYISAANIYAEWGDWEEVSRIRSSMKGVGMNKEPGWSFV